MTTNVPQVPDVPATINEQTTILRELAYAGSAAEIRFLLFAEKIEKKEDWRNAVGAGTFTDYLSSFICDPKRYETGIAGLHEVGVDRALKIGMFAVKVVMRRAADPKVRAVIFGDLEQRAENEGKPATERNAATLTDNRVREAGQRKTRPVVSEADELRAELERKDQEIATLKAENRILRAKVRDLEGRKPPTPPQVRERRNGEKKGGSAREARA